MNLMSLWHYFKNRWFSLQIVLVCDPSLGVCLLHSQWLSQKMNTASHFLVWIHTSGLVSWLILTGSFTFQLENKSVKAVSVICDFSVMILQTHPFLWNFVLSWKSLVISAFNLLKDRETKRKRNQTLSKK